MDDNEYAVEKLLRDLFREDWMDDEDYAEFLKAFFSQTGLSKKRLVDQLKQGVLNGHSIEFQLDLIKNKLT